MNAPKNVKFSERKSKEREDMALLRCRACHCGAVFLLVRHPESGEEWAECVVCGAMTIVSHLQEDDAAYELAEKGR